MSRATALQRRQRSLHASHRLFGPSQPDPQAAHRAVPQQAILGAAGADLLRSEEHTSELQSLMRISYAVFCLKKKTYHKHTTQLRYLTQQKPPTLTNQLHTPTD